MKKYDSVVIKAFLYLTILAVISIIIGISIGTDKLMRAEGFLGTLNALMGYIFMIWIAMGFFISFRLIISENLRKNILSNITFIKEHDERESSLMGQAAKTTFLISLAILAFIFFISVFKFSIVELPEKDAISRKTRVVSIGLGFSDYNEAKQELNSKGRVVFFYPGLPISSGLIALGMFLFQVISYNLAIKKFLKE